MRSIGPDCVAKFVSGFSARKSSRLQNASSALADIEDSVGFFVEVRYLAGCAGKCNGSRDQYAAILDIEANRAKIATVHAPVHRKLQRLAFGFEFRSKGVKRTEWLAIVSAIIQGVKIGCMRMIASTNTTAANSKSRALQGS
jgi:hypothetical protein